MSACRRSSPRFCFNPRLMASWNESGSTPGKSFVGTLPANGLTPPVPGMDWPGVLAPVVVSFWVTDVAAPQIKTPVSRKTRRHSQLSIKGALLASNFRAGGAKERVPRLAGYSQQRNFIPMDRSASTSLTRVGLVLARSLSAKPIMCREDTSQIHSPPHSTQASRRHVAK